MLKSKTFLGIDFGAGTLKVAEFEPGEGGGLKLLRFAIKPLGLAGSQDAAREGALKKALPELLTEGGFSAKSTNICAPGFQVFSKFVKLPPVDTSKVTQIIQYEAQQNVPFPLAETAWDYQILGTSPSGELEVLLVAIKSEIVEKLFATAEGSGFKMEVVDCSIAALANSFRYNYGELDGCSLLIDLGAKTSNVLLFEKNKFYARGITIGSNAITQEFATEAKLRFDEAEKFKIAEGFVSLGGAYEEPDNPRQAAISKVARNVLTRLHLQVNQTIQFYRTQQGGSAPLRVFLCGGGSIIPYATQFFQEKLNLPVEYFNPFRNIQIDAGVDVAELEKLAQCFGEVVGLGLRNIAQCPVELNLMPKSSLARQQFNAKKPFLAAATYALVAGVFAYGYFYQQVGEAKQKAFEDVQTKLTPLQAVESRLQIEEERLKKATNEVGELTTLLQDKTAWADILTELRRIMMETEVATAQKLGRPVGIWIDRLLSTEPTVQVAEEEAAAPRPYYGYMDPILAKRYGLSMRGMQGFGPAPGGGEGDTNATAGADSGTGGASSSKSKGSTNELATVNLTMRAVNLRQINPQANDEIAFEYQRRLKESPLFDAPGTEISGKKTYAEENENAPDFTFPVKLKLRRPLKLL